MALEFKTSKFTFWNFSHQAKFNPVLQRSCLRGFHSSRNQCVTLKTLPKKFLGSYTYSLSLKNCFNGNIFCLYSIRSSGFHFSIAFSSMYECGHFLENDSWCEIRGLLNLMKCRRGWSREGEGWLEGREKLGPFGGITNVFASDLKLPFFIKSPCKGLWFPDFT